MGKPKKAISPHGFVYLDSEQMKATPFKEPMEAGKEVDDFIIHFLSNHNSDSPANVYKCGCVARFRDKAVVAELESLTGITNEIPESVIRHRINQLKAIMEIKE